jgi:DNA-binding Xre family transcriptional regulator
MMKIKIAEVAGKHGLKSAYALQKALNISPTMASRLWKGEFDKIGIGTLEKLCDYFRCQPNDFLEYPLTQISNTQMSKGIQSSNTELSNDTQSSDTELSKTENAPVIAPRVQKSADGMLSTVEVAERLDVSRKSVNDYIIDGKLKATKGKQGHNFVSEADLTAFIESRN